MNICKSKWFGCLQIFKPKKNSDIGIPYKPWNHFAIIGQYVIVYVWDTREIVNIYSISSIRFGSFEYDNITDNNEQLFCGRNTTDSAIKIVEELKSKYEHIPILGINETDQCSSIKKQAMSMLKEIDTDMFSIQDDAKIIFIDKNLKLPDDIMMYTETDTFNPSKRKFSDMNVYIGRGRYFGIIARCDLLKQIKTLNDNDTKL